ncbi:DUF3566 domain-containing protein [Williamsia sterculiae]|uniref:DUF3566 domain-containing protein n=1 Tax=Williamsia sterculiae TaxID=1344003 RepID=A0A1N7FFP8_9NOCA|nr:DUF3566 domain-containing protein [Williamsia sterculiae]SIR99142.1 Transmembrane protein of unknown function [Williamsia sterculiae]
MSTPNDPGDRQQSAQDRLDQDAVRTGANRGPNGAGQQSASGPGGVPPWQRGSGQRQAPQNIPPAPGERGPQDRGSQDRGSQDRGPQGRSPSAGPQTGAPQTSRPVITGTAAPRPHGSEQSPPAPVTRLDKDGKPESPARGERQGRSTTTGRVIDGPTRNIDRSEIADDLPDLDAIHHPQADPAHNHAVPTETGPQGHRGPLRAAVQLRRVDPWSAFKISAVLSVASFFIWMIAIGVLYLILDGMGVWDQVNSSFGTLVSSNDTADTSSFEITAGGVFGVAALIGAINMVLFTALATIGSFIYNFSADLIGGLEVTLADRD